MNLDEFRSEMWAYREDAKDEARKLRDTYHALERLRVLYRRFDSDERKMADQVLVEWLLHGDPRTDASEWITGETAWWDAMVLIGEFKIRSALPALQELARRLNASTDSRVKCWIATLTNHITALSAEGCT